MGLVYWSILFVYLTMLAPNPYAGDCVRVDMYMMCVNIWNHSGDIKVEVWQELSQKLAK